MWPNDRAPAAEAVAPAETAAFVAAVSGAEVGFVTDVIPSRGALPTTIGFSAGSDGPPASSSFSVTTMRSRTTFGVGVVMARAGGIELVITTLTGVGVGSGREV